MKSFSAEGELEFSSVEGTRLQLIAGPDKVRMEASDLRSVIRSWRALRGVGIRPLQSAKALGRRLDVALELDVGGRTIGQRRRGSTARIRPRPLNLLRVIFQASH